MTVSTDPFRLERFVEAQVGSFETALSELEGCRKRSHWMWFVFPQLRGLGSSSMAVLYGIGSSEEARAYLDHPTLGPRLRQCTQAVMACRGRSLHDIFGSPDDVKFCSSMTLFALASDDGSNVFLNALESHCGGQLDPRTVERLQASVGRGSS